MGYSLLKAKGLVTQERSTFSSNFINTFFILMRKYKYHKETFRLYLTIYVILIYNINIYVVLLINIYGQLIKIVVKNF